MLEWKYLAKTKIQIYKYIRRWVNCGIYLFLNTLVNLFNNNPIINAKYIDTILILKNVNFLYYDIC